MSRWLLILFAVIAGWFPPTAAQAIAQPQPSGCNAPRHPANHHEANFARYDWADDKFWPPIPRPAQQP